MAHGRAALLACLTCAITACAAKPPRSEPPRPAPVAKSAEPAEPRCSRAEPNEPADAKTVLRRAGEDVKGCFYFGKASSAPPFVEVELRVAEVGSVARVSAVAGGAESGQLACAEKALKSLRFAKFCGDDVVIRWKYAISR